ncbi:MAG: hypothetical protein F6J97_25770 [Leptolyngbya sp. SIO4C1]|nr:hypothetical protein [Leptolyngbya sp. SIO4C1]
MASEHLEAERQRLRDAISTLHAAGAVAPQNVWISPYEKKGHQYYKLSSKNPKIKNQHLSRLALRDWQGRIQRRNRIRELETQLGLVESLIERQNEVTYRWE